jgi:hypothetical protein
MIYYVNWALLTVFVVFFVLQLKHNGKVTQKHLTGDWRQKLHRFIEHDCFFVAMFIHAIPIIIFCVMIIDDFSKIYEYILLIALSFILFAFSIPLITITTTVILFLFDFIYFNPEGKYVLLKNNSSGEYSVKELGRYPDYYYRNSFSIQILGYKKLSQFESEFDVLYHVSLLSDDEIIKDIINADTIYKILIKKESKITNTAYNDKVRKLLDILYKKEWAKHHIESSLKICSERYPVYFFNEFSGWDEDWVKPYIKNIRDAMVVYDLRTDLRTRGLLSDVSYSDISYKEQLR